MKNKLSKLFSFLAPAFILIGYFIWDKYWTAGIVTIGIGGVFAIAYFLTRMSDGGDPYE